MSDSADVFPDSADSETAKKKKEKQNSNGVF